MSLRRSTANVKIKHTNQNGVKIMNFFKYHGIGNDFIIIDGFSQPVDLDYFTKEKVQALCHRQFGIGGDGILFVLPGETEGNYRMRLQNSDGSEGEMCGNGIRCVAKYIFENIEKKDTYCIETLAGCKYIDMTNAQKGLISVNMGMPIFDVAKIPVCAELTDKNFGKFPEEEFPFEFYILSTGVPHCVIFLESLDMDVIRKVAPSLERHPFFPEGANINFVQMLDANTAQIIVWERGAGFTMACGTGACAVAVASALSGRSGRELLAVLPGGKLNICWRQDGNIIMQGNAEFVFKGEFN